MLSRTARLSSVVRIDSVIWRSSRWPCDLALEGRALLAQPLGRVGGGHRLRREARVDDQEAQVVVGELVEAELRQDEHAEDPVVEDHRGEQHRLVEVLLGARDRVGPRVVGGVAQVLGDGVLRDPAGDALADRDLELVEGLVDVLADLALHRDRDELVPGEPVDPDVVVVDELAQLRGDRHPDLVHAGQPVQAGPELLDRAELGGPRRHPLEVLGGPDRDAGLGREGGHGLEVVVGPGVRPVVIDVEQAEQLGAVEQRRGADRVEALLDDRGTDALAARVVAVVDREHRTSRGDRQGRERHAPGTRGRSRDSSPTGRGSPRRRRCRPGAGGRPPPRSASNRTIAWSTRPDRMRSRSRRLPMSPATRWSASARWSWWATSSRRRATETIVPMALATTEATSPSRGPSAPVVFADEVEHAPRPAEGRDDDREFGSFARQDRERRAQPLGAGQRAAAALLGRIVGERGDGERRAEHAERARPFDEPLRLRRPGRAPRRAGPGGRRAAPRSPRGSGRRRRGRAPTARARSSSRSSGSVASRVIGVDEREIDRMPLRGERDPRTARGGLGRAPVERAPRAWAAASGARRRGPIGGPVGLGRPEFRRGEEALQVAEAVAPVAARIDPVVAQPASVAPGSDRVRVHPQQAGGLGDGQGRIDRA